jgi:hypothetical protein
MLDARDLECLGGAPSLDGTATTVRSELLNINVDITAWGTLAVGLATLGLLEVTRRQLRHARKSSDLTIRPLMSDVPNVPGAERQSITFGPPGQLTVTANPEELILNDQGELVIVSVPFENTGAGPAVIVTGGR